MKCMTSPTAWSEKIVPSSSKCSRDSWSRILIDKLQDSKAGNWKSAHLPMMIGHPREVWNQALLGGANTRALSRWRELISLSAEVGRGTRMRWICRTWMMLSDKSTTTIRRLLKSNPHNNRRLKSYFNSVFSPTLGRLLLGMVSQLAYSI